MSPGSIFRPMQTPLAWAGLGLAVTAIAVPAVAQRPTVGSAARPYVAIDTPIVAITQVKVIDGTGAPARADQTIVIENGPIVRTGAATNVSPPAGAQVIDDRASRPTSCLSPATRQPILVISGTSKSCSGKASGSSQPNSSSP